MVKDQGRDEGTDVEATWCWCGGCLSSIRKGVKCLGSGFGRTDLSRILLFELPIFSRILSPEFSPYFCGGGGKVVRKILQENPRQNPPQFIAKNPRHLSGRPKDAGGQVSLGTAKGWTLSLLWHVLIAAYHTKGHGFAIASTSQEPRIPENW